MGKMNGVNFRQRLVSPSKHRIKAPYSMKARKVTLHNTDNEASALAEINYMNSNNNQISYHLAIDEKEAIQGLPYNRNGWHSGDGGNGYGNRNTIGVEIARNYDRKRRTTNLNEPLRSYYSKAEQNAIKVVAQLCIDQGIVANNDNIKTHNDWNGKWCPSKILNEGRLQQVKQGIIAEYNRLKGNPSKPVTPSISKKEDGSFTMKQVVDKTIAGGYGNGAQRKANIAKKTNFTYAQVQPEVNKRLNQVSKPKPIGLSYDQVVAKTIAGDYGSGDTRKRRIPAETNFSYQVIQDGVNKKLLGSGASKKPVQTKWTTETVARQIAIGIGGWGNGDTRINHIRNAGLNPTSVQNRVNEILSTKDQSKSKKSASQIADEIYRGIGNWGNGSIRETRLKKAGYNPAEVQRLVNQKFR